jgi:hypothetical protein
VYRLASRPAIKRKPGGTPETIAQLGITVWRLRPARDGDRGARQLLRENGLESVWIPERIDTDTQLHDGDLVRISIESPRAGFLYVIDRDELEGDKSGQLKLIFPIKGDANRVGAGRLVDIPAKRPFKASPQPDQRAEVLTIIVTTRPLDLPILGGPFQISATTLAAWEGRWGGAVERFELEGGAGEAQTRAEQDAALGRRQLTRDDAPPQTIYELATSNEKGLLVNVRLRYAP